MEILIDTDSDDPIFSQLISQIKQLVDTGKLVPGFQLPSIRQLAADLGINQNTVAKAYKLLERDAVIVCKGYRGTYIHQQAIQNSKIDHSLQVKMLLAQAIAQLRQLGLTDSEIRLQFAEQLKEHH